MSKLTSLLLLKLPIIAIALLSVAYGGLCLFLYQQQHRIIFFPSPTITTTPADFEVPYTDVWIPVSSDANIERLHGWWMPSRQENRPALLYFHGNGDNMSANASKAAWFHSLGFSVLMIDYRGYGLSDGEFPREMKVYEDAEAAWQYLTQDLQMPSENIVVFGHSLGGAIAIELVTHHPTIGGLIVEGSFTSMLEMSNRTKNYGFLPINRILTQRFESLEKVTELTMPVLYVHGTDDDTVPVDMSELLYDKTPSPKELLLVPGAGHNNVVETGAAAYAQAIENLLSVSIITPSKTLQF